MTSKQFKLTPVFVSTTIAFILINPCLLFNLFDSVDANFSSGSIVTRSPSTTEIYTRSGKSQKSSRQKKNKKIPKCTYDILRIFII